jgi:hypothetical protein
MNTLANKTGVIEMRKRMGLLALFLMAAVVLSVAAAALKAWADKEVIPFDVAEIFFEENATDGDLGIHVSFDGEGWRKVKVMSPDRRKIFEVKNGGSLREIGSTEVFTESEEPSFEDLPREELLALFPEGEYEFEGETVEGDKLVGTATLTHNMPAAPEIVSAGPMVVRWNLVPDPNAPASVIVGYQVVVEKDQEGEPELAFSVDMSATATSVTVPPEFFEPGKDYKVEVIAIETSGNKTITEAPFETE